MFGLVINLIELINNLTLRGKDPNQTNFGLLNFKLKELILELLERIGDIILAIHGAELGEISEFKVSISGVLSSIVGLYNNWIKIM